MANERYECIMEPTMSWTVWDSERNEPAILGGTVLAGLDQRRCETALRILRRASRQETSTQALGRFLDLE